MVRRTFAIFASLALLVTGCGPEFVETMLEPPWRNASSHLAVACVSEPGSQQMGFDADKNQLSAEQRTLLSEMRIGHPGPLVLDGLACAVDITDDQNSTSHYLATTGDSTVNNSPPLIAFASFQPVLATIPCLFSADDGRTHPLAPDVRCVHGIFLDPSPGTIDRFLTVSDPSGQRHLELGGCDDPSVASLVHLQLLLGDGTTGGADTILAEGTAPPAPTPDHACQIIDYTFPAAGAYRMRVVTDGQVVTGSTFRFY